MPAWVFGCLCVALAAGPAGAAVLGVEGTRFTVDGKPTFLLGFSYYGALGAPEGFIEKDLDDLRARGFSWFRVWATWNAYGGDVSAVDADGAPRQPFLKRLLTLVAEADKRGMVVDVTLTRGEGLPTQAAHLRAVGTLAEALRPYRNVYIDLANERDVRDARYVSPQELGELRARIRAIDPGRLVTASSDLPGDAADFLATTGIDFLSPHRGRYEGSPAETEEATREYLRRLRKAGHAMPVHYQEPFRRGYGDWQPELNDFLTDLRGAVRGGAAGWCFHNGGTKGDANGRPRRSFDLRPEEGRLMDQLDPVERAVVEQAASCLTP
jgi:hypothetical protein